MKFTPYPEQQIAIDHMLGWFKTAERGDRILYAAPTGCGKSVIELAAQAALDAHFKDYGTWIMTPREEIVSGMLQKLGVPEERHNFAEAYERHICTPVALRNRLIKGEGAPPKRMLIDEAHHDVAESYRQVELLSGIAPRAGLTATPYRGSLRGTADFKELWGDPLWIITYAEAEAKGYIKLPLYEMLPLINDDMVELKNGEFEVTAVEDATMDKLDLLIQVSNEDWYDSSAQQWKRPTIFGLPGTRLCSVLASRFNAAGLPVAAITAETPRGERRAIFKAVVDRTLALAHVNVVSEGVDLPLERYIDLSPVMSPVAWLQRLGRITRPNKFKPVYVCTNRNLMRHAYLLEGCIPNSTFVEAEAVFGFSQRSNGSRVVGLEGVGRFKSARVKTKTGITCEIYCVSELRDNKIREFAAIAHPAMAPLWAERIHGIKEDGSRDWGKWVKCESPTDLRGFSSIPPKELSEKQRAWWNRSAPWCGLDPTQEVDRKNFAALPVLSDLNVKLK